MHLGHSVLIKGTKKFDLTSDTIHSSRHHIILWIQILSIVGLGMLKYQVIKFALYLTTENDVPEVHFFATLCGNKTKAHLHIIHT